MAVAILYEFPDMTQAQYDRIMREAFNDQLGPGVISHVAGSLEEGGFWAVDVFDSQEAADQLAKELMPGLQQLGVTQKPRLTVRPVHNVLTRSEATPASTTA
jgi:hypothetical protein